MNSEKPNVISFKEFKNIDLSQIKSISLRDGNVLLINNSNLPQQNTTGQPRQIFIKMQSPPQQSKINKAQVSKVSPENATQQMEYSQNDQNYQYYESGNIDQNQEVAVENQEALKAGGELLNDMITYKEQEQEQEGGELQESQAQAEYYNSQEEGLPQTENAYGYEGQQNDKYYMDQQQQQQQEQQYAENAEGLEQGEQGEYYQQDQGYMQGQGQEYQDNQYEGYQQEQMGEEQQYAENQVQENNTEEPKVTVEEIITVEVKEDGEKQEKKEEGQEENNAENEEQKEENNIENQYEQEQEQQAEEDVKDSNIQNQEQFKESEYKGDEEAEAEIKKENKNQENIPEKKEQPKPQPTKVPKNGVPMAKIEYVKYVLPKRAVNPFPVRLLFEEVRRNRLPRPHSHSHTFHPRFVRERLGPMPSPGRPRPLFRPRMMTRMGPPRPKVMRPPMPHYDMMMSQGRYHMHGMPPMQSMQRVLPPRPIFGPPHGHFMPPGPRPRRQIPLIRPRPTVTLGFGPRPASGVNSFYSGMSPSPRPLTYRRFDYPQTQRRFVQVYENYEPEEVFSRSSFITEQNQSEQAGDELGYDDEESSYLTYNMERPIRTSGTRSISQGRNGGFAFNFGRAQPGIMFKRVENKRLVRKIRNQRNNPNNL